MDSEKMEPQMDADERRLNALSRLLNIAMFVEF
ncbi:Uncharacterised protein [uncultured archaeon]|nr:Uncharacterised protein [uncultured archaeon]